uniref:sarcosine oxidasee (formaldehyde-forming) n=1 Tax=Heterorhabditis bacteriophora TaxID=37862 RepID=A0A1I7WLN4_HETBA
MSTEVSSSYFDVIVVGGGIFGSCAAFHSQKLGRKTLLVEQFELNHSNGSSHGKSRIIRYAHQEKKYLPLVQDSYLQISEMEALRNDKLWKKTGLIWASSTSDIDDMVDILKSYNLDHEVLRGSEISARFPQFFLDDLWIGLVDPMGGVLYADKCIKAFQEEFVKLGGIVKEHEEVLTHEEEEEVVKVRTNRMLYSAGKVIFTVGSWIKKYFPEVPLKIKLESIAVCYWRTKKPNDAGLFEPNKFPVFIVSDKNDHRFLFGLPAVDHDGAAKICYHSGEQFDGVSYPEEHSQISEDDNYVIDFYPGSKKILIGGCGSGSGFKRSPSIDVSFFSFARFKKQ